MHLLVLCSKMALASGKTMATNFQLPFLVPNLESMTCRGSISHALRNYIGKALSLPGGTLCHLPRIHSAPLVALIWVLQPTTLRSQPRNKIFNFYLLDLLSRVYMKSSEWLSWGLQPLTLGSRRALGKRDRMVWGTHGTYSSRRSHSSCPLAFRGRRVEK